MRIYRVYSMRWIAFLRCRNHERLHQCTPTLRQLSCKNKNKKETAPFLFFIIVVFVLHFGCSFSYAVSFYFLFLLLLFFACLFLCSSAVLLRTTKTKKAPFFFLFSGLLAFMRDQVVWRRAPFFFFFFLVVVRHPLNVKCSRFFITLPLRMYFATIPCIIVIIIIGI